MFRVYLELQTSNLVDSRFFWKVDIRIFPMIYYMPDSETVWSPNHRCEVDPNCAAYCYTLELCFRCVISLTAGWTHWPMGDLGHSKGPNQTAADVGFLGAPHRATPRVEHRSSLWRRRTILSASASTIEGWTRSPSVIGIHWLGSMTC